MHFSTIALATLATVGSLTNAHRSTGMPKIVGLDIADEKTRTLLKNLDARLSEGHEDHALELETRQAPGSKPECGEGVGSCPADKCCSRSGFCGTTDAYCYSPGCKYLYGPACAENKPPAGTNTSGISRDKLGSVDYGGNGIFRCTKAGTVALTYDDGPQTKFTDHILDLLKSYNAKATFFITGANINKGQIDIKHAETIKRIAAEGHQVASHTWTHLDLSKISSLDRKNQMWMNEMALRNVLGNIPTYMRPPYSSCTKDSGCQQDMADLGYHITNFNVDTDDYNQNNASSIILSKNWFKGNITKENASAEKGDRWLAIGHDILDQTANNLTEYMLQTLQQLGYKAETVGNCLNDPEENWYRTAGGAGVSVANNTEVVNQIIGTGNGSTNGSASGSPTSSQAAPVSTGAANSMFTVSTAAPVLLFSVAFFHLV
ncbi:hypothetical protein BDU57DRAFT_446034 [Ampelomyces quisqualis]|uniref:Glycoside hydrolase/deacetylase n=1 Tax=Ampelomyces quisqualis TaxID=50730 RepID=A0A6A5QQW5_AMPQU|nr:hypothetical protein BDU57DRAFT_446034 [Ampelomyces quisqualis]